MADALQQALDIHRRVAVADSHADSLMWNRDLNVQGDRGHVDFPRLLAAGVKIQCFTVVTRGLPVIDGFSLFARRQRWPEAARQTTWTRGVWQLERMGAFCRQSEGKASIAGSGEQLEANLAAGRLSVVLGIEGAHLIEGQVERVRTLAELGVRFMSLSHLANNELGGTSTPRHGNRPLTGLGRAVLEAMAEQRMVLDISHASPAMLPELLAYRGPLFCSHAGVHAVHPSWRNLGDDVLRQVADRGGVLGVIFAPQYLGGSALEQLVKHIRHAIDVMGEQGVAFGSDFDGMVPLPRGMADVRDLPLVTEALLRAGLPTQLVERVAGENHRRFFKESLVGPPLG